MGDAELCVSTRESIAEGVAADALTGLDGLGEFAPLLGAWAVTLAVNTAKTNERQSMIFTEVMVYGSGEFDLVNKSEVNADLCLVIRLAHLDTARLAGNISMKYRKFRFFLEFPVKGGANVLIVLVSGNR